MYVAESIGMQTKNANIKLHTEQLRLRCYFTPIDSELRQSLGKINNLGLSAATPDVENSHTLILTISPNHVNFKDTSPGSWLRIPYTIFSSTLNTITTVHTLHHQNGHHQTCHEPASAHARPPLLPRALRLARHHKS